jgi:hypothetical protein
VPDLGTAKPQLVPFISSSKAFKIISYLYILQINKIHQEKPYKKCCAVIANH